MSRVNAEGTSSSSKSDADASKNADNESGANEWRRYMDMKKWKLQRQVNIFDKRKPISNIFHGVSIFVNGYTNPPASELRRLIQEHGGEFHVYYEYGTTTFTVATHIAAGKVGRLRKNEKIVHPKWIIDCVEAGERLPHEGYLLFSNGQQPSSVTKGAPRSDDGLNAATDPNFINRFYERSRLHLISTLAQDMKQYVSEIRSQPSRSFPSRDRLSHLVIDDFESAPTETICHVDLDCFFVSVALRTRPELVGKPVAVTHSKGGDSTAGMSEVASCSYEARACGVRNGSLVRDARVRCPDLICVPYQFDEYRATSKMIYEVISRYTVDIRAVSCDEMYVDLRSLCEQLRISDVMGVVSTVREEILRETRCNASVGVGSSMLIARLCTRHAKPNGQFIVRDANVADFMRKEKIRDLPGIGYNFRAKLQESCGEMELCEELQAVSKDKLQTLFGSNFGLQVYNLCRGIDKERQFFEKTVRKSISCDINYGIRFNKESEAQNFLENVAVELQKRLIAAGMAASSITLKLLVRAPEAPMEPAKFLGHGLCDALTRSSHLLKPTVNADVIGTELKRMLKAIDPVVTDLRGVGVQLTRLTEQRAADLAVAERGAMTLPEFFAVCGRASQSRRKRKAFTDADDPILQRALRESLIDEAKRKAQLKIALPPPEKPSYRGFSKDLEVKAEMKRVLELFPEPGEEEVSTLTTYFCHLTHWGNLGEVASQMRYLQRKAAELGKSSGWLTMVAALNELLTRLSARLYNLRFRFD